MQFAITLATRSNRASVSVRGRIAAGQGARGLILFHAGCFTLARRDLRHAPAFDAVGVIHRCDSLQQPLAFLLRYAFEYGAVGGDRFEQLNGVTQTFHERCHASSVIRLEKEKAGREARLWSYKLRWQAV
jgi:hypothetical protein